MKLIYSRMIKLTLKRKKPPISMTSGQFFA